MNTLNTRYNKYNSKNYIYKYFLELYLSSFHYPLVQRIVHGIDNYTHNRNVYLYSSENRLCLSWYRYSVVHEVTV